MLSLMRELCSADGVSGNEREVSELIRGKLSERFKVEVGFDGSAIASIGPDDATKTILFDAHIDQIGLVVTSVDKSGFLRVEARGGVDARVLPGSVVAVHGRTTLTGIVRSVPPHLNSGGSKERDKFPNIGDLFIDLGMDYEDAVLKVSPGDTISLAGAPKELINDRFSSHSTDNRAGVCVLIKLAEKLSKENLNIKFVFLFSSQEEVGGAGAKISSYGVRPDEAVAVDVSFAAQPGAEEERYGILGGGPLICLAPGLSREVSNALINAAADSETPYRLEVSGGKSGTNADHISISRGGVKCGLLSIPQRYMHTGVETVCIGDLEKSVEILFNYAKSGGAKV